MIFLFHESCPFLQSFYHEKNQAFEMKLFDWLKYHVKLLFEIGFLMGKQQWQQSQQSQQSKQRQTQQFRNHSQPKWPKHQGKCEWKRHWKSRSASEQTMKSMKRSWDCWCCFPLSRKPKSKMMQECKLNSSLEHLFWFVSFFPSWKKLLSFIFVT